MTVKEIKKILGDKFLSKTRGQNLLLDENIARKFAKLISFTHGKKVLEIGGYTGFPTFKILSVVRDTSVTIETKNLPPNDKFDVTMGPMGTKGIGGIKVGSVQSGLGGTKVYTFATPSTLYGSYKISIRMQSPTSGYYAYNWFYNNDAP